MTPTFKAIDYKLDRAETHINNFEKLLRPFRDSKPYALRIEPYTDPSGVIRYAELVAVKNPAAPEFDDRLLLIVGEALYQLRSALDHLVHQLVILNGKADVLKDSRTHKFPILKSPNSYGMNACGMIYGVSSKAAELIENAQPYKRTPDAPAHDPLWILQNLNNTDKHRVLPATVTGIGHVTGTDDKGTFFDLVSPDVVLEDNKRFFRFTTPNGRYDDIHADLTPAIAFKQAMTVSASAATMSMDSMLWQIVFRVREITESFRPMF
jgi:hypothetical protein